MSNTSTKRFEDWEEVDCNSCARYWDSSCDSVSKGSKKPCNSFLATRSMVIPQQIDSLRIKINTLTVSVVVLAISLIIHVILGG